MSTAITRLIARYGELIDAGDFAGVGALFAHAAFISGGHSIRGSGDVEEMLRRTVIRYDDGTPRTQHVTTDVVVEFDEQANTATARSAITVFQALPGFALQPIAAGRYRDRFECHDGAWRFAERRVDIHLTGDLSHHLRAAGRSAIDR